MNVVLIGMKHCGKSTVGRGLAGRWAKHFIDTDQLIEQVFEDEIGMHFTVREIFANHGEAFFADLERRVVKDIASQMRTAEGNMVVALGGPTVLRRDLQPLIREMGTLVYLLVEPDELLRRVLAGGVPPFLDPADPEGSFRDLCRQRTPVYEDMADMTVDLNGLTPDQALRKVLLELAG